MPEVHIAIGGRSFEVACQDGEQPYLEAAARMLDAEAQSMADHGGRMPEGRMLLMAGLMLADKTAALEEKVTALESEVERLRAAEAENASAPPEPSVAPVGPDAINDALAELAARAEALAEDLEGLAPR